MAEEDLTSGDGFGAADKRHKISAPERKESIGRIEEGGELESGLAVDNLDQKKPDEKASADHAKVDILAPLSGFEQTKIAGKDCIVIRKRGEYRWIKDKQHRVAALPDIVFPKEYLGQKPMSADQLKDAANWLVYDIDPNTGKPKIDEKGNPVFNDFFLQIKEITKEDLPPFLKIMAIAAESKLVKKFNRIQDIHFPYYENEAMVEMAKVVFGSRIKKEYESDGSQYLYEVIGPVYDFFHQMNTQAIQQGNNIRHIDSLPIGIADKAAFAKETSYYPNDAEGRDVLAGNIADELKAQRESGREETLRILGVGDGPAISAIKTAVQLAEKGVTGVQLSILEYNREQINNGKRAYEGMDESDKEKLSEANVEIQWVQGDASAMPIGDSEVDVVFSSYVVGAMGGVAGEGVIRGYARESLRVLKKNGKHMVVDFYYEGDDMKKGYLNEEGMGKQQGKLRRTFEKMKGLLDAPLRNCFHGIWDHNTKFVDHLNNESEKNGADVQTRHKQNWFGHFPVVGPFGKVLTFSVPGYNEMHSTITKM